MLKQKPRAQPVLSASCRRRDQQLYEQRVGTDGAPSEPKRVTDPDAKLRFADGVVDATRKRLIAVQEDHSGEGEAVNTVSAVGARQTAEMSRCTGTQRCVCMSAAACSASDITPPSTGFGHHLVDRR